MIDKSRFERLVETKTRAGGADASLAFIMSTAKDLGVLSREEISAILDIRHTLHEMTVRIDRALEDME